MSRERASIRHAQPHRRERLASSPGLPAILLSLALIGSLGACRALPHDDRTSSIDIAVASTRGLRIQKPVSSFVDQRFKHIVPQRFDFSCGAAALATLLRFYYDEPIGEEEVVREMLASGDLQRIQRDGFSLLDLKQYAERRAYETRGVRVDLQMLERIAIPAITLIQTRGYSHFVVLKGVRDGAVYLADPAIGQRRIGLRQFSEEWQGALFFVAKRRPGPVPSPLQALDVNLSAPLDELRRLEHPGIARNHFFDPLEF